MRTAVLAVFLIGSLTLQAQSEPKPLRIPIQQFKLDNGLVAVGDAAKLKPVLDKYGAVQAFNTGGKPKATP